MNTEWISVEDRLPENKTYVLVHLLNDNWSDSNDQEGCLFVVAKFVRTREKDSNNLRPYKWEEFGPDTHFGQDVDFWMPIQRTPNWEENRSRINNYKRRQDSELREWVKILP